MLSHSFTCLQLPWPAASPAMAKIRPKARPVLIQREEDSAHRTQLKIHLRLWVGVNSCYTHIQKGEERERRQQTHTHMNLPAWVQGTTSCARLSCLCFQMTTDSVLPSASRSNPCGAIKKRRTTERGRSSEREREREREKTRDETRWSME